MTSESVYKLLQPSAAPQSSPYTGKYDVHLSEPSKPTYSTFFQKGKDFDGTNVRFFKQRETVIGKDVGDTVDPKKFLKKGEGVRAVIPPIRKEKLYTKPPVSAGWGDGVGHESGAVPYGGGNQAGNGNGLTGEGSTGSNPDGAKPRHASVANPGSTGSRSSEYPCEAGGLPGNGSAGNNPNGAAPRGAEGVSPGPNSTPSGEYPCEGTRPSSDGSGGSNPGGSKPRHASDAHPRSSGSRLSEYPVEASELPGNGSAGNNPNGAAVGRAEGANPGPNGAPSSEYPCEGNGLPGDAWPENTPGGADPMRVGGAYAGPNGARLSGYPGDGNGDGFMGIPKSRKNFIASNIVEVSNMVPKNRKDQPQFATDRKDFGKTPAYLSRVKQEVAAEKEMLRALEASKSQRREEMYKQYVYRLPADEHARLVDTLKQKLQEKKAALAKIPFSLDTISTKKKRSDYEQAIRDTEVALSKLEKDAVFIYKDDPVNGQWTKSSAIEEAKKYAAAAGSM